MSGPALRTATRALVAGGWVAGWLVAGRPNRLGGAPIDAPPTVSIIVPARNEAHRLPNLLAALASDRALDGAELIVVDDRSADGTADLALRAGARVIRNTGVPLGWVGKPWACWCGAGTAEGQVLVFLDADVEPAPGFVDRLVAGAVLLDGLVSVQPSHRVVRLYERLSAVGNVAALMAGTGTASPVSAQRCRRLVRRIPWRYPLAYGAAMAIPRDTYLDSGGHTLVRGETVEDVALAHALAQKGCPVSAYADAGEGSIRSRMYPEGPRTLIDGWSRTLAAGARRIPVTRSALVALWVSGALCAGFGRSGVPFAYPLFAAQSALLFRRAGTFGLYTALAFPLPFLAFVGLFGVSVGRRCTGWLAPWRERRDDR